ncbi:MAG: hypothetical protein JWM35_2244, partial [Verrucomicrobia bacterium]|nr:hypothetical protein [Verrucomicrobiota bacterium]
MPGVRHGIVFMKPPPLPEETLRRVLRVANFNGKSVL